MDDNDAASASTAAALAADRVYDSESLGESAAAFHAQLSMMTCLPAFQT